MRLVVGVVAEGKDDFGVLYACISAELGKRGVSEVVFRQLQPEKDATGQTESGGWTKVVGWLQNHSGSGIETFFSPLFSNDEACNLLIIHIDGDIYKDCVTKANLPIPSGNSISEIVGAIRLALANWLSPPPTRTNNISYAIPVYKTENWILASIKNCPVDTWSDIDAKTKLRSLFDQKTHKSVANMKNEFILSIKTDTTTLINNAKSYRIFADDIAGLSI